MSEAELYLMRQRLHAGRLSKVHRGEYVQRLPTGLVRLADHRVIKDPDRQIQHVIALVFSKLEDIGSGYGVLRYCKHHDILQPRLRENAQCYTDQMYKGQGAPREGAALLQGLATCGLCGHRMRVAYRPRARYICMSMKRAFAEARCAHLDGPSIEAFVVQAFF